MSVTCVAGLTFLYDDLKDHSAFIFKGWKTEGIKRRLNCLLPFCPECSCSCFSCFMGVQFGLSH